MNRVNDERNVFEYIQKIIIKLLELLYRHGIMIYFNVIE
jgi:hypothetical protein